MFDAHCEDVDADDEGDEEVQVVARAQRVDGQTQRGVVGVVGPLLGLWGIWEGGGGTDKWDASIKTDRLRGSGRGQWCAQTAPGAKDGKWCHFFFYSSQEMFH